MATKRKRLPFAPQLYSLDDAAACLALSRRTVWTYVRSGALPSMRFGQSVRVSRSDLLRFARSRLQPVGVSGKPGMRNAA